MVNDRDLPRLVRARLDDPISVCTMLGLLEKSKRQPGGVMIRCPAHQDADPSCSVTCGPDGTLRWRCFSCSASGDALTLVAAVLGLDIRQDFARVLEAAAGFAGIHISEAPSALPARALRVVEPAPEAMGAEEFAAIVAPLERVGRLDGSGFATSVATYLESRGLLDAAREDGWFAIAPDAGELLGQFFARDRLVASGLVNEWGGLSWSEHSLCIPWRNAAGVVHTIQRRHLGDCDAKRRYVFPNGRGPAHPYGFERLQPGPIALVEGAMDVLARRYVDKLGWTTVLGVPGVSGWRSSWDVLARDRVVLIAYDDDEAGNREALKLADRLYGAGAACVRRSTPTRGKDWADSLRRTA